MMTWPWLARRGLRALSSFRADLPAVFRDHVLVARIEHARQQASYTQLPSAYVVPADATFPPELHGRKLNFSELRRQYKDGKLDPAVVQALDAVRFVWQPQEHNWELKFLAFETYKRLHGDLLVRQDFVVPKDDPSWPRETWGMKLGLIVTKLRATGEAAVRADRHTRLATLGFVWNAHESSWLMRLEAYETFKRIHGNLLVPLHFVIPAHSPAWPRHLWRYNLGRDVNRLRLLGEATPPERKAALDALGFVWEAFPERFTLQLRALSIFKELRGHVNVPSDFVVPDDDPHWPEDMHGMHLGFAAANLSKRRQNLAADRRAALDALGFAWRPGR
ncbi:hypothetical protein ACHHYP_10512 [Achlya hypogyna]|uniref:Helicase-associated domain-containing protein n=1 Tax=Achlya hypogyna TaxID=1202772 RepID=A0A1V9YL84_ACHHY|nr:hypothetical protein ACHHYP_10512 [Achlya hypogyna]